MAKRKSVKAAGLAKPEPPKEREILLANYVSGPDFGDVHYAVLRLTLNDLLRLREMITLAAALDDRVQNFYRFEVFDWGAVEVGGSLIRVREDANDLDAHPLTDPELAVEELQEDLDSGGWTRLPEGWAWPEGEQHRSELEMLGAGKTDVLWHFRQKHCDYEYETNPLGLEYIEELIKELTSSTT